MKKISNWIGIISLFLTPISYADVTVTLQAIKDGNMTESLGKVTFKQSQYGLLIFPQLQHLPPGLHGFHLHEKPFCDNAGMGAGGHFDPAKTNKHLGPYTTLGHLGDLPALYVDQNGEANTPILAPRLTLKNIKHHALMIHAGGDNYSDNPAMGGGGIRIGCGVIN